MGTYIAKIKNNDEYWYKIADGIENSDYTNIDLRDAMPYDPNNAMADQWFKIEHFDGNDSFIQIFSQSFDSADLTGISREQYDNIDFIAFYDNNCFYMQNVTKGNYLKKKWLAPLGDLIEYREDRNMIYINPIPNCIYDQDSKNLYFMSISKAYAVFKNLKGDYKEATREEVANFLGSNIVETVNFDNSNVGLANRKRITAILNIYNNYNTEQKQILRDYIHDNIGDALVYTDDGKFQIESDEQLRLLLMGIQQRFYTPPLQDEVQVATNTTRLSNLIHRE